MKKQPHPTEFARGTMKREAFIPGEETEEGFWAFVRKREEIRRRRERGQSPPWTDDPALREWKFTNVFREADRTTRIMREREALYPEDSTPGDRVLNATWFRMLGRAEHAHLLPVVDAAQFRALIRYVREYGGKLFTGAYITWPGGTPGETAREPHVRLFREIRHDREAIASRMLAGGTLEGACAIMRERRGIGKFLAYEIVTDLRWTILRDATDRMTWCNINPGGGSARGLRRIGMPPTVESCRDLLRALQSTKRLASTRRFLARAPWPFEMREVEHSLCEFDKYCRCHDGGACRPKTRYRPRED